MKAIFVLFAAFLAVFVSGMEDAPAQPLDADNLPSADNVEPRVTCDLVSGLGFNHALCAAHCIFKGHKGGYCDSKGICNCRD